MRTILLLVPLGAVIAFGCSPAPGPPFKPVVDVQQLMEMMVDPAADVVWDAVGTVITAEGTDDWFPQTDEEWAAVRNSAVVLMESGNLLMMGEPRQGSGHLDADGAGIGRCRGARHGGGRVQRPECRVRGWRGRLQMHATAAIICTGSATKIDVPLEMTAPSPPADNVATSRIRPRPYPSGVMPLRTRTARKSTGPTRISSLSRPAGRPALPPFEPLRRCVRRGASLNPRPPCTGYAC